MPNNGPKVFVPKYGAGIMSEVEDNEYDKSRKYISICLLLNNINLYMPEDNIREYEVRSVITKEEMEEALNIIKNNPNEIEKKWGKRYRNNNDKIKSGNTIKICEVIRDLYYLKLMGNLPPGERKILYKAEIMLASEIMLIFDISMEDALSKIRNVR
ncbi:transcriptional regulator [Clostridium sp. CX1]|uniref:CarD family transcriptional regulator n=1 Tax=Clostridium sp. CX1 TaxID=2978346 RepID=UPI0021C04346|nr:CarD family transcriptional regulator [Clostridium sp. CX1]MCT8976535.1 transcriptional regulator [Clostridium sp. CX1]